MGRVDHGGDGARQEPPIVLWASEGIVYRTLIGPVRTRELCALVCERETEREREALRTTWTEN